MALERIVLNIIPAGEMPVFHCSQYENGRPVIIDLVSSDDDAFLVPEGATVELHCRKVDDNIVTLEPDEVDNNTVTFVSTEQLTACPGDNLCEVVLYADTDPIQTIATLNFILHVEPDPLEGGLTSDTQIYNLTEQIEEITQQVIGDDYYDKTEVDSALALKADKADTYTKTQVDNALALKADVSNVYTKSQVDASLASKADTSYVDRGLALKANSSDVYTKAQTYSQAEVDALIDGIFPTFTASGLIASFTTALTKPLVSVTVDPLATNITRCGENFFSYVFGETLPASGTAIIDFGQELTFNGFNIQMVFSGRFVNQGAGFLIGKDGNDNNSFVTSMQTYVDANGNPLQANTDYTNKWCCSSTSSTVKIRRIYFYTYPSFTDPKFENVMCEGNRTPSTYTPYNGQIVPVADATTLVTQPGVNNVFADSGDVTVQYKYMSM